MKVTVCFGSVRVLVPCGGGELLVRELVAEATRRYRNATGKVSAERILPACPQFFSRVAPPTAFLVPASPPPVPLLPRVTGARRPVPRPPSPSARKQTDVTKPNPLPRKTYPNPAPFHRAYSFRRISAYFAREFLRAGVSERLTAQTRFFATFCFDVLFGHVERIAKSDSSRDVGSGTSRYRLHCSPRCCRLDIGVRRTRNCATRPLWALEICNESHNRDERLSGSSAFDLSPNSA